MTTFTPFGKIPRLVGFMTITEKIDGTNAAVVVNEDGTILAQSRNRFITPREDNYGFAAWVGAHEGELRALGSGVHFGEWWGQGVQRGYDLVEKRFSLFNVARWSDDTGDRPDCCHVVPTLRYDRFDTETIEATLTALDASGSIAAPGFMRPEGVMVWHERAQTMFKYPFDSAAKGRAA
jgi:hypothetical protein